jgi:hypothetical protein
LHGRWGTRIGRVLREEMDRVGVGDERARTLDEPRDDRRDRERHARAEACGDRGALRRSSAVTAHRQEGEHEHGGEQELRRVDVGDDGVLDRVVANEQRVREVSERLVHVHNWSTRQRPACRPTDIRSP